MANSNVIPTIKKNIISAIVNDKDIFSAIAPPDIQYEDRYDMVYKYVFPYNKNPNVVTNVITFITVMVHTEVSRNKAYVNPTLEIWIYSHNDHIEMNLNGIKDTRCDFIAKLLDDKFNGSTEYGGIGKLELVSNTEGNFNQKFLYRRLLFRTTDLNNSMCGSW